MTARKTAIISCVGIASVLQIIARHYDGSQIFQAILTFATYGLLACVFWILSSMILDGETALRRDTFVTPF